MCSIDNPYIASSATTLILPRAQEWTKNMLIYAVAENGCSPPTPSRVPAASTLNNNTRTAHTTPLFQVLEHLNRGSAIEPNYRMILMDYAEKGAGGDNILALTKYNRKGYFPHWSIYTNVPTYIGQPASCSVSSSSERDQVPPNMFLYGMLYTTGEFVQFSPNKQDADETKVHYEYRSIRGGKTCGACCGGASSRRVVCLEDAQGKVVWTRDQLEETMLVAKGQNLAASAALAYVLDRHIKPLGSTAERQERARQTKRQAEIMGLGGTGAAKIRARMDSRDGDHGIRVHTVDGSDSWHVSKELTTGEPSSQNTDPESHNHHKPPQKKGESEFLLMTKTEQCSREKRPRRKRQLSAPILEMDGNDTSTSNGASRGD